MNRSGADLPGFLARQSVRLQTKRGALFANERQMVLQMIGDPIEQLLEREWASLGVDAAQSLIPRFLPQ
jgi:hypothetical protein